MNDFTKEELKELIYALDCCHSVPVGVDSPILMLKIQSMIDNYCDHKYKYCGEFHCSECEKCNKVSFL